MAVLSNGLSLDQVIEQINFPVELRDFYFKSNSNEDIIVKGQKIIVRSDIDQELAVVSNRYELIPHNVILKPALEALHLEGYNFDKVLLHGNGKRIVIRAVAPKSSVNVWDMTLMPRIFVVNSYDRSTRVYCRLGLMSYDQKFSISSVIDGSENTLSSTHSSRALLRVEEWQEKIKDNSWLQLYVNKLQNNEDRLIPLEQTKHALLLIFSKHQINTLFPDLKPMTYREIIENSTKILTLNELGSKDKSAARRMIETSKRLTKLQQYLDSVL